MKHVKDHEHATMIGFIELLNAIGMNIVAIDNSFYSFTSFEAVDDIINEITLVGKNITVIVENTVATAASTTLKKHELISRINEIPLLRRTFHPNTEYVKYLAT